MAIHVPTSKRNYAKEYASYVKKHGLKGLNKRRNVQRQARKKMGLKAGDPREVDHKTPLYRGGGNGKGNLRVVSFKTNRSRTRP